MPHNALSLGFTAAVLKVDDQSFKDLYRNSELDPYEDSRMPVEKRVADLFPNDSGGEGTVKLLSMTAHQH